MKKVQANSLDSMFISVFIPLSLSITYSGFVSVVFFLSLSPFSSLSLFLLSHVSLNK